MTDTQDVPPAEAPALAAKRALGKPWRKGVSGNPAGRPMKTYATAERIRAALIDELPAVIASIVKASRDGDVRASEVLLKLCIAPLKPVETTVRLNVVPGATLAQQGEALLSACARGEIQPSQAAALMMGLGAQARVVEVDDLKRRIEALEGKDVAKS